MTTIHCLVTRCEHNVNRYCTKMRVRFVGMKCMDVKLKLDEFEGIRGRAVCSNVGCSQNMEKRCRKDELYVGGEGCITKEEWGKYDVGRNEGGHS